SNAVSAGGARCRMSNRSLVAAIGAAAWLLGGLAVSVASAAGPGRAEMSAAKARIQTDYQAAKAACRTLRGNGRDVCLAEARGRARIEHARLAHLRSGSRSDAALLQRTVADAEYAVARERCDEAVGAHKDACMSEAHAAR